MLNKSFSKNLSIKEQESLILKKFVNFESKDIFLGDLKINVFFKKRFFFKKIEEKDFLHFKYLLKKMNKVVSLEATVFNEFKDINLKEAKKFIFSENTFFNPIENNLINVELKKILLSKSNELIFDTSLFNVFYLNRKTVNHFSKLYLLENMNIYLLKRKNIYYLFGLNL